jgi:two-component system LytT family sensor kinase
MQDTISSDKQTSAGIKTAWHIFWHLLFWLGMISLFIFLARMNDHISPRQLIVIFLVFPAINIGLFYINFLVYIPRFSWIKNDTGLYLLALITIIVFGIIKYGAGLLFKDVILIRNNGQQVSFVLTFLIRFLPALSSFF